MSRLSDEKCYRRCRTARAFEDKLGGWTLLSSRGQSLRLCNTASIRLWDALGDRPATLSDLVRALRLRFPEKDVAVLHQDAQSFLDELLRHGIADEVV